MTTAAGALDIIVSADTAQASSSLSKFAAAAEREMKRTERAGQQAQRELDRMTAGIQRQIDTFGMTGAEITKYEMRLKGASAAQLEMVDRLERMKSAHVAFNAVANSGKPAEGIAQVGKASELTMQQMQALTHSARSTFDMILAGQSPLKAVAMETAKLGGTFTPGQMLEQLGRIGGAIAGIGLLAGAVGGLALAFYQGHEESEALAKSLTLTGNYAGVTEGQFRAMAHAVATSSGATLGASREIVQGLIATGNVGPNAIQPMADAIARLQKNTGEDTDKIVADFAKMGDGVAKWAEEHNKSYNYLSLAQFEHIRRLEEEGRVSEAMRINSQALADHLGGPLTQNLGLLGGTLNIVASAWRAFWDSAKNVGRAKTVEQDIADIDARIASNLPPGGAETAGGAAMVAPKSGRRQGDTEARNAPLLEERDTLLRLKAEGELRAFDKAQEQATQKEAIAASNELKKLDDKTKGIDRQAEALKRLKQQEDAIRAAGGVVTDEQHAARVAEIKRENAPAKGPRSAQDKLDDAFTNRMNALGAENAKLDAEADSMDRYGKVVNKSRVAVLEFDIAQGKLKDNKGAALDLDKQYLLWEAAYNADLKEEANNTQKAVIAAQNRSAALGAAAEAQAMNARQTKIATELEQLHTSGLARGTKEYEEQAAIRIAVVNKEFDNRLKQEIAAQHRSNAADVRKIDEDADSIGMSSLERMKRDARRPAREKADRQIEAGGDEAQIIAAMIADQNALTEAIQRRYDASRTADAGVATALQKYQEDATNFAKSAETLTAKFMGGLEDNIAAMLSGKKVNWKSFVNDIINEMTRLYVIKPLLASIFGQGTQGGAGLGAIFGSGGLGGAPGGGGGGGLGGWLAGLLGGGGSVPGAAAATGASGGLTSLFDLAGMGFASGGRPPVGRVSVVGENGPELFVPDAAGTVIPNGVSAAAGGGAAAGGRPIIVNVHQSFPQGTDRRSSNQAAAAAGAAVQRALARQS